MVFLGWSIDEKSLGNDAVSVSLKCDIGHLTSRDGCKKGLEQKLNRFSFAAAAVILGCLLSLKGPDVLRYWYVMERAFFIICSLGTLTSFLPLSLLLENRFGHISSCAGKYLHRVGSGSHSFGKYLLSNYSQCQTLFPAESKSNKTKICLQEVHTMEGEMVKGENSYSR